MLAVLVGPTDRRRLIGGCVESDLLSAGDRVRMGPGVRMRSAAVRGRFGRGRWYRVGLRSFTCGQPRARVVDVRRRDVVVGDIADHGLVDLVPHRRGHNVLAARLTDDVDGGALAEVGHKPGVQVGFRAHVEPVPRGAIDVVHDGVGGTRTYGGDGDCRSDSRCGTVERAANDVDVLAHRGLLCLLEVDALVLSIPRCGEVRQIP